MGRVKERLQTEYSPDFRCTPYLHKVGRSVAAKRDKAELLFSPERVGSRDAKAHAAGDIEPEPLPELSGDRCDGHGETGVGG